MPYIRPTEAGKALGVYPRTLARWSKDGKIKAIKTEGWQRRDDIAEYLLRGGVDSPSQFPGIMLSQAKEPVQNWVFWMCQMSNISRQCTTKLAGVEVSCLCSASLCTSPGQVQSFGFMPKFL